MTQTAGELERYGFEEIEPYVVVDSSENRKRIRSLEGDWFWEHVRDETHAPTGLIRVLTPSQMLARRDTVYERRKDILVDPENAWSDYVEPDDYPMDADVPYFIKERLSKWKRAAANGIPEEERQPFPRRCETIRHDETRCWNWASNPDKLPRCKWHAGWVAEERTKLAQYAKQRLLEMTPDAVDRLEWYAHNAEGEAVGLKATTEILDRAGVRSGFELEVSGEVEVKNQADEVRSKLDVLRARALAKHEREQQERERLAAEAAETPALPPAARDTVQGEVSETRDDES